MNLVLNLDPAERNRKSMMNYLTEYIREVPLNSKAKQAMARNYAFHLQVCTYGTYSNLTRERAWYGGPVRGTADRYMVRWICAYYQQVRTTRRPPDASKCMNLV